MEPKFVNMWTFRQILRIVDQPNSPKRIESPICFEHALYPPLRLFWTAGDLVTAWEHQVLKPPCYHRSMPMYSRGPSCPPFIDGQALPGRGNACAVTTQLPPPSRYQPSIDRYAFKRDPRTGTLQDASRDRLYSRPGWNVIRTLPGNGPWHRTDNGEEDGYYHDTHLGAVPTDDELATGYCFTPVNSGWIHTADGRFLQPDQPIGGTPEEEAEKRQKLLYYLTIGSAVAGIAMGLVAVLSFIRGRKEKPLSGARGRRKRKKSKSRR